MTLNLSRARKPAVTARSPTTFELHIQLLLLLLPSFVFLFLDPDSETLAIAISCGQSTLPLEIIARSFLMEARI